MLKKEENMDKAEFEKDLNPKGKRMVREQRRIESATKQPNIARRLKDYKAKKQELVKALDEAGHRESALLLKNWDQVDEIAEQMYKSNYGPKGMGQYTPKDNIQRKASRTGDEYEHVGRNKAARQYTTSGSSMTAAHEAAQAKEQRAKTKASTKTLKDFSPEEIKAMEERANMKKDEYNEKKIKEKKEEYKYINEKTPDPFKQNMNLAKPKKPKVK
jgi:hypothetical protein